MRAMQGDLELGPCEGGGARAVFTLPVEVEERVATDVADGLEPATEETAASSVAPAPLETNATQEGSP